jgi:hypothetical protein
MRRITCNPKRKGIAEGRTEVRMHLLTEVQMYIHDQVKQLGCSPADFIHLLVREHQHKNYMRAEFSGLAGSIFLPCQPIINLKLHNWR